MNKLTAIRIKNGENSYSDQIPISVLAENVQWNNSYNLTQVLGNIDVNLTGNIQQQINTKLNTTQLEEYVSSELNNDVTEWMDTHLSPLETKTTVIVDDSLSVSGAAADAKTTGERISDLETSVLKFIEMSWDQGIIAYSNGTNSTSSNRIRTVYAFSKQEVQKVKVNSGFSFLVYAYDNSTFKGVLKQDNTFSTGSSNVVWLTSFNLNDYPDYKYRIVLRKNNGQATVSNNDGENCFFINNNFNDIYEQVNSLKNITPNILQSSSWTLGNINPSTGKEGGSTSRIRTINYIPDIYTYIEALIGNLLIFGYDEHEMILGMLDPDTYTFDNTGTAYPCQKVDLSNLKQIYPKYKYKVIWYLSPSYTPNLNTDIENIRFFTNTALILNKAHPLSGKKIVNMGDSIFGLFNAPQDISTFLSEITGATCYNTSFGGTYALARNSGDLRLFDFSQLVTAIVSNDYTQQIEALPRLSQTIRSTYTSRINTLSALDFSTVDIITIAYGTNDYNANHVIGTITDGNTTFIGTLLEASRRLLTKYPQLRIVFITPIFRMMPIADSEDLESADIHMNTNGNTLTDFVEAINTIAKTLHTYSIDNYYLGVNEINYNKFYPDTTHPNLKMRKILAHNIANKLA